MQEFEFNDMGECLNCGGQGIIKIETDAIGRLGSAVEARIAFAESINFNWIAHRSRHLVCNVCGGTGKSEINPIPELESKVG